MPCAYFALGQPIGKSEQAHYTIANGENELASSRLYGTHFQRILIHTLLPKKWWGNKGKGSKILACTKISGASYAAEFFRCSWSEDGQERLVSNLRINPYNIPCTIDSPLPLFRK